MPNRLQTAFQTMSKVFDGSWVVPGGSSEVMHDDMPKEVIYSTEDPLKYQEKKLELQQNKYLHNRWIRANQNLSMSAFANLSNIKLMYRDADLMDSYPEIGAALDLCSEESVQPNPDNGGQIVNVTSKSDRIRSILEDLFVNRLNLQVTAQMVIRAMCKYGNQFMLLDIDKDLGVKGWRQLPVGEVERIENGIINPYGGAQVINANTKEGGKDTSTRFMWTSEVGGDLVPFRNWQIAHFRLLHNSIFLPYGVSMLSAARRHFRMLALLEDAALLYHINMGQERRVFKIYVGSMDDNDIGPYIEQIANQFKRTPIVDPMTGQLDLRKNILPVWRKTPIPLLDGRTINIEDLAKEYEEGKENYVYSVQDNTHQIVPGKVVWCGKNYTADKLYKITLDDDSYMVMAGEHEVVMRDGSKKRADELVSGESVMPFNGYEEPALKNHKVKVVEVIAGDDVYCMTVEGLNGEQDRHNFALKTFTKNHDISESGCFVTNCNSEDFYIPVRNENATNPIETLQAGKNVEAIDDIKYIQKKVCAALRIPQSFLNFEEATGDGKNLALMDVRFARTINRFQQAFLMELTKVATIHLYLLGFEDDLTNFSLSMNNPSTQAEQLELENLQKKVSIIRDAVSDPGNGIPVMSIQEAWKRVLKLSDNEIKEMLEQIRLEKALAAEYEKTSQIIKRSGIFDTVDRIYGEPGAEYLEDAGGMQGGPQGGGPMGGGGGGSFGAGLEGLGAPGSEENGDIAGEEGSEPVEDMGNGGAPAGESAPGAAMEGRDRSGKLLKEQVSRSDVMTNRVFNRIVEGMGEKRKRESQLPRVDVYDKSLMINEEMNSVISKLDDLLNDSLDEIMTEDYVVEGKEEVNE